MSESRAARTTCKIMFELAAYTQLYCKSAWHSDDPYLFDASADIERQVGSMSDAHVPFLLESRNDGEVHFGCTACLILFSGADPGVVEKLNDACHQVCKIERGVGDRCQSGLDDWMTHVAACGCLLSSVVKTKDA